MRYFLAWRKEGLGRASKLRSNLFRPAGKGPQRPMTTDGCGCGAANANATDRNDYGNGVQWAAQGKEDRISRPEKAPLPTSNGEGVSVEPARNEVAPARWINPSASGPSPLPYIYSFAQFTIQSDPHSSAAQSRLRTPSTFEGTRRERPRTTQKQKKPILLRLFAAVHKTRNWAEKCEN